MMKKLDNFPKLSKLLKLSASSIFLSGLACSQAEVPTGAESSNSLLPPAILTPGSLHVSKTDSLTITGSCISEATVTLEEGSNVQTTTCTDSRFSFDVTQASDGTFTYRVHQSDNQGNSSGTATITWVLDRVAPFTPIVTNPTTNPGLSNKSVLHITGTCENGATVSMSGAGTGSVTCLSSTFSLAASKSTDGNHTFNITQTDPAGNTSSALSYVWTRDTVAPAPPIISSPASNPYSSAATSFNLSGVCEIGGIVSISGSMTEDDTCTDGTYQFNLAAVTDGTYSYLLTQKDVAGNISTGTSFQWVKSASAVPTPTITVPATSPLTSNSSSVTISGGCTDGATVTLGGDVTASNVTSPSNSLTQSCSSSAYSFTVVKASDATYNFSITQTIAAETSAAATTQWVRDTVAPLAPTITLPASSPHTSNTNSITLSGACETGALVQITGDSTNSAPCVSSAYSFTVSKTTDATYNFSVMQTDAATNVSTSATLSWIRDTTAPAAPVITNPASSPVLSNLTSLTISGTCESGNTVNLSGAETASATCTSSAFSFTANQTTDGTFNYSVTQTDTAGNTSLAATLEWQRNSAPPAAPNLTSPSPLNYFSNGNSISVAGTCDTGNTVTLSGDDSGTTTCSSGAFSFTVNKSSDATYNFSVTQTNTYNSTSSAATASWTRDTLAPLAPLIVNPASSPTYSAGNNLTISGICEDMATVTLSGDASNTVTCSSSSYSFTVSKTIDGTYNFNLAQTDPAGNASLSANVQWVRDSTTPPTPVLTSPSPTAFISNGSSITVAGSCVDGNTVNLTGDASNSAACSGSVFSFIVSQSTDATYNFSVTQTNIYNTTSAAATASWTRDTVVPATPVITMPASSPHLSNASSLTLGGACETGTTVNLSGDDVQTMACSASTFSFSINEAADGIYNYSVTQTDAAGNTSTAASQQWDRSTAAPTAPVLSSPSPLNYISNTSLITIAGSCVTGNTVSLAGGSTDSTSCASSAFSFTVSKSTDATYNFSVTQTDSYGNISPAANASWSRDTVAPAAPTVTTPASNPYTSSDSSVSLSGACETGATINLTGAETSSATCSGGLYNLTLNQAVDGTYNYTLTQVDMAGNTSTSASFQWVRAATVPSTPTITSPASNPLLSNTSSVTLSGGCTAGDTVSLSGDISALDVTSPSASLTQTCSGSNTYSYTFGKSTDGTYNLSVTQTNTTTSLTSAAASFAWTRDTAAPSVPLITNPASSPHTSAGPLTLSGSCETGATVQLAGDDAQSTTCASSAFSFTVSKSTDATYNFTLTQTDLAGNISSSAGFQWIRDTSVPSAPVVTVPATASFSTNTNSVTISGTCTTGYTITMSGDVSAPDITSPAGSLTQTCTGSAFSYTVSKASDGVFNLRLKQTSLSSIDSAFVDLYWTRDTVGPNTTIATSPANPNFSTTAAFTFTASEGSVTYECSLDGAAYASCVTPYSLASLSNSSHTLNVRAKDALGNADTTPATYTWTQMAYNTVALYHFNNSLTDSSLFTSTENNTLTATNTSNSTTMGMFSTNSRQFTVTPASSLSKADNGSLDTLNSVMTYEGWIRLNTVPTTSNSPVLASKMGASGNFGWEIKLIRNNNTRQFIAFTASLDGTTVTEIRSSAQTLGTTAFNHIAVTWNRGTVAIYLNGTLVGSGTIGTAGSATIFNSTAPLRLGQAEAGGDNLDGYMDEVRLSQVVRWSTNFTPPAAEYGTPD